MLIEKNMQSETRNQVMKTYSVESDNRLPIQ